MITCHIEHHDEVIVVRLDGTLILASVPAVRAVLAKCLAECPTALIVDLGGVALDSDLPLTVFRTVQRQAAYWPGIPVLLAGPSPALADRMAHLVMARHLPIYDTVQDAIAALDRPMRAQPTVRADLPATRWASREARRLVARACRGWNLAHLVDDAEVIASELASNAVRHACPPLRLVVATRGDYLHVAVRDGSGSPPRAAQFAGGFLPDGGVARRGLWLVAAFAASWGSMPTADGKVVWATLRARPIF
jgi:anti-sigma regulatory factor (Ser/Thr protein kinase)/anti-anti-sigma regulatory factor